MRTIRLLITGILCLMLFINSAIAQELNRKITLKVKDASLEEVLQTIHERYNIRFSYLNNELPSDSLYTFDVKNKALSEVLDELLVKTAIGYKEHNGQVIIKQGFPKNKPKEKSVELKAPAPEEEPKEQASEMRKVKEVKVEAQAMPVEEPVQAEVEQEEENTEVLQAEAVETKAEEESRERAKREKIELKKELKEAWEDVLSLFKQKNKQEEKDTVVRKEESAHSYHYGIIYPLSNHGTEAGKYVNYLSAHLLVGYDAGLHGIEFSGVGNIEKDTVKGIQFGGAFNIVGDEVSGLQYAGALNLSGGDMSGAQFSGFLNIADGEVKGAQFSGFGNIATDNMIGIQAAGFLNVADSIRGAQLAGFLNTAKEVHGLQAAGFINNTGFIKGTQLGFINIADSTRGVPIGFLSFAGKNGYMALEAYTAEDFQANLAFKTGVNQFYNIIALGVELEDSKRWAYGYGLGSEWILSKRFHLNTDLIGYHVIEKSYEDFPDGLFEDYDLNVLGKLRVLATLQIGRNFALFGGPTYNIMVSQYQPTFEHQIGSNLVSDPYFDRTYNNETNVKMWIGFNAGLRF